MEKEVFYSDKEVAERYNVRRPSVWRWVKVGILPPPIKLSPGCTRWPLSVLRDWEKSKEVR